MGWTGAEQAVRLLLGFVVMTLVARKLGPQSFAIYSYAFAIFGLVVPIARMGLQVLLVRGLATERGSDGEKVGTAFVFSSTVTIVVTLAALASLPLIGGPEGLDLTIMAFASLLALATPAEVFQYYQRARERLDLYAAPRIAIAVFVTGVTAWFALGTGTLETFVALRGIEAMFIAIAGLMVFLATRDGDARLSVSKKRFGTYARAGFPIALSGLGAMLLMRLDQIMLGQMASDTELGQYGLAVRIAEVANVVPIVLSITLLPALARNRARDAEHFDRYLQKVFDLYQLAAWPVLAAVAMASSVLLVPVFGEQYAGALPMILCLLVGTPFFFAQTVMMETMNLRDWSWLATIFVGLAALVNCAANLVLIPILGGVGAGIATVLSYAGTVAVLPLVLKTTRPLWLVIVKSLFLPGALLRLGKLGNELRNAGAGKKA